MYVTSCIQKTREILANLIQTLTSKARLLNLKACGVQGRNQHQWRVWGGRAPHQLFFNQMNKFMDNFFPNFKSVHIYMKEAEFAESNEKSI